MHLSAKPDRQCPPGPLHRTNFIKKIRLESTCFICTREHFRASPSGPPATALACRFTSPLLIPRIADAARPDGPGRALKKPGTVALSTTEVLACLGGFSSGSVDYGQAPAGPDFARLRPFQRISTWLSYLKAQSQSMAFSAAFLQSEFLDNGLRL